MEGALSRNCHRWGWRCWPQAGPPSVLRPEENGRVPLFPEHRGPQVPGAALWPHTMMGHFLSQATRTFKRLDLGSNPVQDMGTRGPHRRQWVRPGSQFSSWTLESKRPAFKSKPYHSLATGPWLVTLCAPQPPCNRGNIGSQLSVCLPDKPPFLHL